MTLTDKEALSAAGPPQGARIVVMGVSGCGKSAVGQRIAQALGLPLIEGDEFHPAAQHRKDATGRAARRFRPRRLAGTAGPRTGASSSPAPC